MRTLLAALTAITLCLGVAACDQTGGQKLGIVDMNRLMRESVPGKAGLKFIESQQTDLQAKLDAIQERLEKNPKDEAAMQELQKTYAESQQKIQAEGQAVVTRLFDAIQKELDAFRVKNGYAMLIRLEALDSYDPALDVTNTIMAEVDKIKLDFSPAPSPASQVEEKTPAAAK